MILERKAGINIYDLKQNQLDLQRLGKSTMQL